MFVYILSADCLHFFFAFKPSGSSSKSDTSVFGEKLSSGKKSSGKKSSGDKSSLGPKTSEDTKGGESSEPETLLTKEQMDSFKPGFDKFMDSLSEDFDKSQFSTRQSSLRPRSTKPSVSGMAGMGSGKFLYTYLCPALWGFLHLKSALIRKDETKKTEKNCQIWLYFLGEITKILIK